MAKLKPCGKCGVRPVVESWSSGGMKWAVRCDNPERGEDCDCKFYKTISRSRDEAVRKWNELN